MAVLNLLLSGNTQARATPELADVVACNGWTTGRKFRWCRTTWSAHRDMESAGQASTPNSCAKLHHGTRARLLPGRRGFQDARELRAHPHGDDIPSSPLNEGAQQQGGGGGWAIRQRLDAASFEAAMLEAANGEESARAWWAT